MRKVERASAAESPVRAGRARAVRGRASTWLLAAALALVTGAVFSPVRHFEFLNYDDPLYVTDDPRIAAGLTPANFLWAWSATQVGNWHPLTTLSHLLDVRLFGLQPGAHHLVSAGWHVLSTLLLFGALLRMTAQPWPSAWVAAMFAVHPLHVESVAWIAERKDVLSTFFCMLALWIYPGWVRRFCSRP